jgi:hypothetical protein
MYINTLLLIPSIQLRQVKSRELKVKPRISFLAVTNVFKQTFIGDDDGATVCFI